MTVPPSKLSHRHLLAFAAVVRNGQFSEAGLELDLTQSAISQAIQAMESTLGTTLFERGRFGARPTAAALTVLPAVHRALEALHAVQHLQPSADAVGGRLRLVSFRSAAVHLLAPLIAEFTARHPDAQLELRSTEDGPGWMERALLEGHADAAVTALPVSPDLLSWPIGRDEFVMVASRAPKAARATWAALEQERLILCGVDCSPAVLRHLSRYGCFPQTSEGVQEESVVLALVAAGLGYTILPRLALLSSGQHLPTSPLPVALHRQIGIVTRRSAVQHPLLAGFLSFLLDKVHSDTFRVLFTPEPSPAPTV